MGHSVELQKGMNMEIIIRLENWHEFKQKVEEIYALSKENPYTKIRIEVGKN